MNPHAWQDGAACKQTGVNLFFGPEYERNADRLRREPKAKALCAVCPVIDACREWSLGSTESGAGLRERYGVWAGMNEDERIAERRRLTRKADERRKAERRREAREDGAAA
jgi:WhiB family redox-sensing transcriptional regulator